MGDVRALGSTTWMESEMGIFLADAVFDAHVIGLLEADPVPMEATDHAMKDLRSETSIEEDASSTATVEMHVLILVPVDGEAFEGCAFNVVTADDGEDSGRLGVACHHAIGIERSADGKGVSLASRQSDNGGVKPT